MNAVFPEPVSPTSSIVTVLFFESRLSALLAVLSVSYWTTCWVLTAHCFTTSVFVAGLEVGSGPIEGLGSVERLGTTEDTVSTGIEGFRANAIDE